MKKLLALLLSLALAACAPTSGTLKRRTASVAYPVYTATATHRTESGINAGNDSRDYVYSTETP
jgi:hypothetical protein